MKSPLKRKPLRNPGQSLDERLDFLINDKLLWYLMGPVVFWVIAGVEWISKSTGAPRMPGVYALVALASTGVSAWQVYRLKGEVRNIKQGRDGERAVGQFLEDLRTHGAKVFHDVQADDFNLDHVVVTRKGVFVIETKTWSKPAGKAAISIRDGVTYRNGHPVDKDAVGQALAEANWLRRFLIESVGERVFVHPVLLFPGWWVEPLPLNDRAQFWALEPKALPEFIARAPDRLSVHEVAMVSKHLSAWITR